MYTDSGTYVQITYKTHYTKYEAQEDRTSLKELDVSSFKILGYYILSEESL